MFDRKSKLAFFVVSIVLLLSAVGFNAAIRQLNYYLDKQPVHLRDQFVNIPRAMGEWEAAGYDEILPETIIEALGTDVYLNRVYERDIEQGRFRIDVHIAYYTGMIDAIPHVPDRCFVGAGLTPVALPKNYELEVNQDAWRRDAERVNRATGEPYPVLMHRDPVTGRASEVRLPIGDYAIRTIEFEDREHPNVRLYGGYFFLANGRVTPSPEDVKLLAFDMSEKYAYYCKVQLTVPLPADEPASLYSEQVSDLLVHLLPEIMRCLPDWSDVEQSSDAEPTSQS